MGEKGILFNAQMVRAILDGRKTVTRRIIKNLCPSKPPYRLGDTLYVRETFTIYQTVNYVHLYDGRAFSEVQDGRYAYKADGYENIEDLRDDIRLMSDCSLEAVEIWDNRWHPSVHMPKEAARIWLRVTDVRVERLWDMTTDDAIKEGVQWQDAVPCVPSVDYPPYVDADAVVKYQQEMEGKKMLRKSFGELWDSTINEKDLPRYGWNANPWVWVIEFERVEKTQ